MPFANKSDILEAILQRRISAIIRTTDTQLAADAMGAAVAGGFRIVEFTLTTPGALQLIRTFSTRDPDLLVGAGTVLSAAQAQAAVQAGARFIVSPVCDPAVIAAAGALQVVSIPGTFTATEMFQAHRAGADLVKLFPAPAGVAQYIRSILGPLPELRIFPTAGVDADNMADVLRAGAAGVGFVGSLFVPEELQAGNFGAVERRARDLVGRLASV